MDMKRHMLILFIFIPMLVDREKERDNYKMEVFIEKKEWGSYKMEVFIEKKSEVVIKWRYLLGKKSEIVIKWRYLLENVGDNYQESS